MSVFTPFEFITTKYKSIIMLSNMSEQQIRTQLLYCRDDPVKKLVLEKYLKLLVQKQDGQSIKNKISKKPEKRNDILTLPVVVDTENNDDDELLKDIYDSEDNDSDQLSGFSSISIGSSLDELEEIEEDKPKDTTLNRDHLNNNLMERMNSDIYILNQSRKPVQFQPPFGEGGTDIYPSFEDIGKDSIGDFSGKKKY